MVSPLAKDAVPPPPLVTWIFQVQKSPTTVAPFTSSVLTAVRSASETATVSGTHALLDSSDSVMTAPGSTAHVPLLAGLENVPEAAGVTLIVASMLPPAGMVSGPPAAVHVIVPDASAH